MKLLLIGRPGAGKTTAYSLLESIARAQGSTIALLSDYPILYQMCVDEKIMGIPTASRRFLDRRSGGFDVLDFSLFDEVLRTLEAHAVAHPYSEQEDALLVLEFARNDYQQAFAQFSPGFLADAMYLCIDADAETCIGRIEQRVVCGGAYVSSEIMRGYYGKQLLPASLRVERIENSGTREAFEERVRQFVSASFQASIAIR